MVRQRDCLRVHNALNDSDCPLALRSLFVKRSNVSVRETRAAAAGELHLAKCRLSATQRTFSYRAAPYLVLELPAGRQTQTKSRGAFLRAAGVVCENWISVLFNVQGAP